MKVTASKHWPIRQRILAGFALTALVPVVSIGSISLYALSQLGAQVKATSGGSLAGVIELSRAEVFVAGLSFIAALLLGWLIAGSIIRPLQSAIDVITSASEEIAWQAQAQAQGAADQATAVAQVVATIEELSHTAMLIAEAADRVTSSVESNLAQVESARKTVQETVAGMENAKSKVQALAQRILALGEKAQQIGTIIDLINDIADETHLLALNAAIEAAGAGEHGRRFAVVAAEVKRLADRALHSTEEVRALVSEVQAATNAAVMATEEGVREAEQGMALAYRSGESITGIVEGVQQALRSAQDISLATQQQRSASAQAAVTVRNISEVSQQTAAGSQQTAAIVSLLADTAHNLTALVGDSTPSATKDEERKTQEEASPSSVVRLPS